MKVNLANKFGLDKVPNVERAAWADERIDKILHCADNPKTDLWYFDADYPFSALGIIFEMADAIRSGDPENFYSGIPVAQDGSCNGLQHYAAMTRDEGLA